MKFICGVHLLDAPKPTRGYLHEAGYIDAFGDWHRGPNIESGVRYLTEILGKNTKQFETADFLIAFLWGKQGKKVAELFGFSGTKHSDNPDVYSWVFENGVYKPEERQICCGDSLIVLGREEEFRRTTPDLKVYTQTYPMWTDM